MSQAFVLSYWNLNEAATGGVRRVNALLDAIGKNVVLCQPGPPHPVYDTACLPRDWGRRKSGINWGLFNFFRLANAALVRQVVAERHPAVIVLTSIWTFFPLRRLRGIPLVLDAHDVLAAAMEERYGAKHPFTLIVAAWERRVARRMDHLFTCSEADRARFISRYQVPADRVSVVPNGVEVSAHDRADLSKAPPAVASALGTARVLFFMGKLSYEPNARGLAFLNDDLMPELERRAPGRYKLVVTGGPAPPRRMHPSIVFAGAVSDAELAALMKRADICLSPTFSGGGTRLKILEYMAARKPVVTTPKGMEGLECLNGRELVVADAEHFPDAVEDLVRNPARAQALADAAHRLVTTCYDWTTSIRPLWRKGLSPWVACG